MGNDYIGEVEHVAIGLDVVNSPPSNTILEFETSNPNQLDMGGVAPRSYILIYKALIS